jgi:hypothetical protein
MPTKQKQVTFTKWHAIQHTVETGDDTLNVEVSFTYLDGANMTDGKLQIRLTPGASGGDPDFFIVGTIKPFGLNSMAEAVKRYYKDAFTRMIGISNVTNLQMMNVSVEMPITYLVDVTEQGSGGW